MHRGGRSLAEEKYHMSAAAELRVKYQEALAAKRAALEAEAQREEAGRRAQWEQAEAALFTQLAPFIPDGGTVEWKVKQAEAGDWLAGYLMVDGDERRYQIEFIARTFGADLGLRAKIGDRWREVDPSRLAEYIGAAVEYEDALAQDRAEYDAEHAAEQAAVRAERDERIEAARAEHAAEQAAAAEQTAAKTAAKAAKRADRLARKVAEAEAIAAAQAKHLVNPSGLTADDAGRWAQQAIDAADEAGARLPAVEQLRTEINVFERQLKEAQSAATWGAGGANETERKNNAARALAADPEVRRLQAALDQMNRQLAIIEPEYKAQAMKAGAWRAVCELYAGWLQSLR